ncbi:MAG: alpha/beta fold hydrolase [Austwickia sp.]|jgi:pimeloyl-ACP methyl ester carboxylesterase|nr:alpha/beta fold hydrolase [Austwickia sp.]MBK8435145.1 alpha/beta fold hydrolase [Austwickia sp.]
MSDISKLLHGIATPEVQHEQIHLRGLNLHVQLWGEGPPLLLYSGIFADVHLWETLLPYLQGFRTIAFDPPGVGKSSLPRIPMNMFTLAELGTTVLDLLGVEKAHVLGASFGGAVAQQMAFLHPRYVDKLVLVSTSFGGFAIPGDIRAFAHFCNPNSYKPGQAERLAGPMFGGRLREEPELINTLHMSKPKSLRHAAFRYVPLWGWTSLPWLWAIKHETLIVAGDDDPVTPLINHRIIDKMIPNSRLHVVPGGGHLVLMDSPERVGPVVAEFLREDSAADARPKSKREKVVQLASRAKR